MYDERQEHTIVIPLNPWDLILAGVGYGFHPTAAALREGILAGHPIPEDQRAYVASRIADRVPGRGRGRPKGSSRKDTKSKRWHRTLLLLAPVLVLEGELKAKGVRGPWTKALEKVAEGIETKSGKKWMSGKDLEKKIKDGLEDAPEELKRMFIGHHRVHHNANWENLAE